MWRWIPCCAGLLLLGCVLTAADTLAPGESAVGKAAAADRTRVDAVAQDTAGGIWGIDVEEEGRILRRGEKVWEPCAVPGVDGLRARSIESTADGGIVCVWVSPGGAEGALTRHHGDKAAEIALFNAKLNEPRLLTCADGTVIVTERGPTVVTVDAAWKKAQVRKLPDDLFRGRVTAEGQDRYYTPTCAVQDAAGQLWLWSYVLDAADSPWRLAELVRFTGERFERFPVEGLLAGTAISDVLPSGPHELWIARTGEGLWSVDTEAKQAAPLPEASFSEKERKEFTFIERMRAFGDTRYVVTSPQPSKLESAKDAPRIAGRMSLYISYFYDQRQRTGALFRHRDGKWEKLIAGLDENPRFGWWERPWTYHEQALLVGALGSGPWVIPNQADAKVALLNWRERFPLRDAVDFCVTPNDDLLCVSTSRETALVPRQRVQRRLARQVETLKTLHRLWRDARGHIWQCCDTKPLTEWDGTKWIERPFPSEIAEKSSINDWLADDRDRGWLFFESGTVAICHFESAQWQVFDTVESALQAQLPEGVQLGNLDHPFLSPVFSGDGRCAFLQLPDCLSYFDGAGWRHWPLREIAGEDAQVDGGPFFAEARQLCFPLSGRTHQWDAAAGKWLSFDAPLRPAPSTRPVEEGQEISISSPIRDPASVALDLFGIYWLTTREGELKKLAPGVIVSAFYKDEPHPFQHGLKVHRALIDAKGGAWLETSSFGPCHSYVFLPSLGQPETKAELLRVEGDTAVLRFSSLTGDGQQTRWKSAPLFSYQLDGGKWQRLTEEPDLTLTHLAAGRHRLLARAFLPDLNLDPTPAVVEWEIRIEPEQQWRALLAELSAPDLSRREAAAKAFREQGAAALPFLRKARETAPDEMHWWIDAILQQIHPPR